MPIFGQKTYILSKLHYLLGHKSQYIGFFNHFCIYILYVFYVIFKKYSFGGYPFLKILEKYSFLFYSFFPNFGIFFKKYSFMVSSFVANFRKSIRFGSFLPFFLKVLVWGLFVMIIFSKSIRLEFMRFGIFLKKYLFAIYSFYTFFRKCIRFGLFVFSNE